jgi:hypothetical protein
MFELALVRTYEHWTSNIYFTLPLEFQNVFLISCFFICISFHPPVVSRVALDVCKKMTASVAISSCQHCSPSNAIEMWEVQQ